MSCGIYKITNLINQHSYIGQSVDILRRWRQHRNYPNTYCDYPLYAAFKKYGIENFSFEVLEECSAELLNEKEIYYISLYDTYYHGYNQTAGGSSTSNPIKISNEDLCIIYDLLKNSNISQNEIANQFNVGIDTISEINNGKTRRILGYDYPLRKNHKDKAYCIDCGKIVKVGPRCAKCANRNRRMTTWPSREVLKQLIRTFSFVEIGRRYGVTDKAIRKWCAAVALPTKTSEIKKYSDKEWELI